MRQNVNGNFTDLSERPTIKKMLPHDFTNMVVFDLCCGYGEMSEYFAKHNAKKVIAFDISEKMIEKAIEEHSHPNIQYAKADLNKMKSESEKIADIIYSSVSLHFIEDLDSLFRKVYALLKDDGKFVFSIEHPIASANPSFGESYGMDKNGENVYYKLKAYFEEGKREFPWFAPDIPAASYHHTFSAIVNALSNAGFFIEQMAEPAPDERYDTVLHRLCSARPSLLIIKCSKR